MDITDIIGEGKSFEPPFECHVPIGCRDKTYIWDKFGNCILEIRGAQYLQSKFPGSIAKDVQKMQKTLGDTICQLLNEKFDEPEDKI